MKYLFIFIAAFLAQHKVCTSSESEETLSASEWFLCNIQSTNEACRQKRSQPLVTPLQPLGESPTEALEFSPSENNILLTSPAPKKKRKLCSKKTCFHGECENNTCVCKKGWRGAYCKRDVDECRKKPCSQICVNTDGGYACTCCANYYLDVDLSTCVKEPFVENKIRIRDQPRICQKISRSNFPQTSNDDIDEVVYDNLKPRRRRPKVRRPAGLQSSQGVVYKHRRRTTKMKMSRKRQLLFRLLKDVRGISKGATSATQRILILMRALRFKVDPPTIGSDNLRVSNPCTRAKCRFQCVVTSYNRARCTCPRGYRLDFTKRKCIDVDECALAKKQCPAHQRCHNNQGGHECKCIMGYKLVENNTRHLCEDINECETGENVCDSISQCINKPGYYRCICPQGFDGDGVNCTDPSEQPTVPLTPSISQEPELDQEPRIYNVVNADGLPARIPKPATKRLGNGQRVSAAGWRRLLEKARRQRRMKYMKKRL